MMSPHPIRLTFSTALLFAVFSLASGERVIINTDPGIDDSMAIFLALASPELDVIAITINFGSLHNTSILAENALRVLELANRSDVPVFVGAGDPLASEFHDLGGSTFHGNNGLGDIDFPSPRGRPRSQKAAEYIVDVCSQNKGGISILSLSPMTNIALALDLEPDLPKYVKHIYLMGGTAMEPGNVSPLAEANIANDALSARRVFAAGFHITMAGLDVTMHTRLYPKDLERIRNIGNAAGTFIHAITQFYLAAYRGVGYPYMPVHDPSAVMALLRPDIYTARALPVEVLATRFGDAADGVTAVDRRGGPLSPAPANASRLPAVLLGVDEGAFKRALLARIATLP